MYSIDLNSDMGESFGAYKLGGDEEIIKYIATNIKSNIRELEGAFNKIIAFAKLNKVDLYMWIMFWYVHSKLYELFNRSSWYGITGKWNNSGCIF